MNPNLEKNWKVDSENSKSSAAISFIFSRNAGSSDCPFRKPRRLALVIALIVSIALLTETEEFSRPEISGKNIFPISQYNEDHNLRHDNINYIMVPNIMVTKSHQPQLKI